MVLIRINKQGHNYEKNLNIKGHFAYLYRERVLAKFLTFKCLTACDHVGHVSMFSF